MSNKSQILVTSPSINIQKNVSGIANLTRLWIENNKNVNYVLFEAGKMDIEKRNIRWFFKQFFVIHLFNKAIRKKNVSGVHINTSLEKLSILRDFMFGFSQRIQKYAKCVRYQYCNQNACMHASFLQVLMCPLLESPICLKLKNT